MGRIDYGQAYSPLLLRISECGDVGFVHLENQFCFVSLIDGLGHGKEARMVSIKAIDYIKQNITLSLEQMMVGIHNHIRGTRGAVISLLRIDISSGEAVFCGIGNITTKRIGVETTTFLSKDGIVGYNITNPKEKKYALSIGDIVILYSDGIKGRFEYNIYDQYKNLSAQEIATNIVANCKRENDDASCIVIKYLW